MPFHRLAHGTYEIFSIQAMPDRIVDASAMFPNATAEMLRAEFERVPAFFGDTPNDLRFTQNIYIVKTVGNIVLVDTGVPTDRPEAMLLAGMVEAGIPPDDVDTVILTHRDMDHVGGATTDGLPTFKNATYYIGRSEYESFRDDATRLESFAARIVPLEGANVLRIVDDNDELLPEIRLRLTPGHRSGATSVLVGTGALILAEVWHSTLQVVHPEISISFDTDPVLAATTRAEMVALARQDHLLVGVPHTPFGGLGYVVDGWRPAV